MLNEAQWCKYILNECLMKHNGVMLQSIMWDIRIVILYFSCFVILSKHAMMPNNLFVKTKSTLIPNNVTITQAKL